MTAWTEDRIRRFLEETELFGSLSAEDRDGLASRATVRNFAGSEPVLHRGDSGDSLFVVAAGKVRVTLELPKGAEEVSTLAEGDFFGEIAMMTRAHRTATVTAVEAATLVEFPGEAILALTDRIPEFKSRIARTGAQRSRESLEKLIED